MIGLLPKWTYPDSLPAFYDVESVTAIEGVAKMGVKINELITDYNNFVDEWNSKIAEFEYSTTEELETFEKAMIQKFQDFIDVVTVKITLLETGIKNIEPVIKEVVKDKISSENIVHTMGTSKTDVISQYGFTDLVRIRDSYFDSNINKLNGITSELKKRIENLEDFYLATEELYTEDKYLFIPGSSGKNVAINIIGGVVEEKPLNNNICSFDKVYDFDNELKNTQFYEFNLGVLDPDKTYYLKIEGNVEAFYYILRNVGMEGSGTFTPDEYFTFTGSPYGQETTFVLESMYCHEGEGPQYLSGSITGIMLCLDSDPDKSYKPYEAEYQRIIPSSIISYDMNGNILKEFSILACLTDIYGRDDFGLGLPYDPSNPETLYERNYIDLDRKVYVHKYDLVDGKIVKKDVPKEIALSLPLHVMYYEDYFFFETVPGTNIEFKSDKSVTIPAKVTIIMKKV